MLSLYMQKVSTQQEGFGTRRVKMGRVVALAAVFLLCCLEGCLTAPSSAANSTASGPFPSSDGSLIMFQAPQLGYSG